MDASVLGNDVQNVNVLTVIASESYDSFAKGLQSEIAEAVYSRPRAVTEELFKGKVICDTEGNETVIDTETARAIFFAMVTNGYVDKRGALTDKYYANKANGDIVVAEEVADCIESVIRIVDSVYNDNAMRPEDARKKNVELSRDPDKEKMPEFMALWEKISPKSVYVVDFDTDELVRKSIDSLELKLKVPRIYIKVETGSINEIKSKEKLVDGEAFVKENSTKYDASEMSTSRVKYDLVGRLVAETGLTRKAIVQILTGIKKPVFEQFKNNPEEFILRAAAIINDEKATAIIQHITYDITGDKYGADIFADATIKGTLGVNAVKVKKHLYDYLVYDSAKERDLAAELDASSDVAVYVKLPNSFYISTPVGRYNPDWAIAFYEGSVKHIFFVAETKGTLDSLKLNHITPTEQAKIDCAREHFKAISGDDVVYDVVDSYEALLERVMK